MELDFIDISPSGNKHQSKSRKSHPSTHGPQHRKLSRKEIKMRKARRRRAKIKRACKILFLLVLIIVLAVLLYLLITGVMNNDFKQVFNSQRREFIRANETEKPDIKEDFLTPNPYSRPGEALAKVKNIFIHYTANPGTSAAQNRSYFENMATTGETSASAHFVIGYEGEIIQCLPLNEIGYAVKSRNYDSISIECCYLSEDGKFTDATYQSLIQLTAWLLKEYKLAPEDMMRHYDEGGKMCPLYYVEHEEAWLQLINDVEDYIIDTE